ncbi:hypothetical protein KY290_002002 [Solanum tuberosum]|uniref:DC1 domain-containing protein n=1 Tax=Solanum tuberosum TaxID=4113 RepID=A0ABQ7WNV4_SOLTU|nr:hypothetical protein KY290_002002 [Solanum tuberosum]
MGRLNGGTNAGKQHFSHDHILKLIANPTETLTCNACEKPNNTNKPFYGCNTCQYFLHENCFNAPRFLNHSSHPSHPLTLHHPPYAGGYYICNACGSDGNGFCYNCAACDFDIHLQCASCPSSILVDKHTHQLELHFGSPDEDKDSKYVCDICFVTMSNDNWLYYCAGCDFASHLYCVITSPEVGVFPKQQHPNPNPNPNPSQNSNSNSNLNPNAAVEMINSVNDDHDRLIAAQIRAQIEARGRRAALDLI